MLSPDPASGPRPFRALFLIPQPHSHVLLPGSFIYQVSNLIFTLPVKIDLLHLNLLHLYNRDWSKYLDLHVNNWDYNSYVISNPQNFDTLEYLDFLPLLTYHISVCYDYCNLSI